MTGQPRAGRILRLRRRLLQAAVASCFATAVQANPVGPSVASGTATFSAAGNSLTVTNSPGAIINWQSFSIRPDEVTRFIQSGAASAVLNRVTGPEHSALLGQLLSNGRVFLINPNGVTIGAGARIDTAGFVASSLALSNEDFLAGKFRFTDPGHAGKVANAGTINVHSGGPVYLVAPSVENHGVITAPNGDILLAAGKSVELVSANSPALRVQVQAGGEALNVGRILADSGRVGIYGAAIRNAGLISADSAEVSASGTIVLKAARDVTLDPTSRLTASGPAGGAITVQAEGGTLLGGGEIEALGSAGAGGEVRLLGAQVGLTGSASIDASGSTGGGTVLVGGDYLGSNPDVPNAQRTVLAPEARIAANATDRGDGGKVILWSDEYTGFYGAISARGGPAGGNGGFVETSSKENLQAFGAVDAAAPGGRAGEWLLDPSNVTIAAAATANGAFDGGSPANIFSTTANDAVANVATIVASLNAGTNVTINTTPGGTQAGDIVVQDAITKTTTTGSPTLALNAAGSIQVNNAIQGSANGRVLNVTLDAGGDIAFGGTGSITSRNGSVTMDAGGAVALGNVSSGTGALSVTASGAVSQNAGTALTVGGVASIAAGAANDVTLGSATNSLGNVRILSGNNVLVRDNTAFSFGGGASNVSGNLTVDANGSVTQAAGAALTVGGTATINTRGANRDVTLTQQNDFAGAVNVVPAANNTRNVALTDANALTLGTVTATGTLTVQSSGAITDTGTLTVTGATTLAAGAANDITLDTATNSLGNVRIVSGNDVLVRDNTAFSFGGGASSVAGNLTVDSNGNVTQAAGATLTVGGTTTINTRGANRDITLTQANDFAGAVSVVPAANNTRNVSLRDANAITLGTITATGNLAVQASGAITDTGTLAVGGTTTLTAGATNDITLDGANNFGGQVRIVSGRNVTLNDVNALAFGAGGNSTVSGNLSVTAAGAVTQARGLVVTGTTTIDAGAGNNITLTNTANNFVGAVSATGNNVSLRDTNALVLGTVSAAGTLAVTSNGAMTDTGAVTVGGATTLTAGAGNDITLDSANDFGGPVRIVSARDVNLNDANGLAFGGGASTVSRNLTVTADGPITQANPLTAAGATSLAAGAGNDITLTSATNSFGNVRIVSGRNVSIRDNTAFSFGGGASSASGNLTVDSNGNVTQAAGATVTVGGTTTINTRGANRDITLTQANDLAGAVAIAPLAGGTIRDVSYRNVNALALTPATPASHRNLAITHDNAPVTLAGKTLSGTLAVTAGGAITDTGALAVTGTTTLAAGANDITLDTATNSFGNVRIASGNNVFVRDNTAFSFGGGASSVSGNLTVDADGNVTQAAGATLTVGGTATVNTRGANRDVTLTQANDFGGEVGIAAATGNVRNVSLVDATSLALGAAAVRTIQARALAGDLTLNGPLTATAAGNSIVLDAAGDFVNNAGAAALSPGPGRWVVYSASAAGNTFGSLASGSQAIWNATFVGNPPATIPAGNRYVFSEQPTVTFSSTDAAKVYGDDATAAIAGNFASAGFVDATAFGNVFTQDTAANAIPGVPSVTSAGAPASAGAGVYPIDIAAGTLAPTTGYALAFNAAGQLTVGQRPIAVTADNQSKVYGSPDPGLTFTVGGSGLAGSDSIGSVFAGALTRAPGETVPGGPYAITQGTLAANANYTITLFSNGQLVITPKPISVTANDQSKAYGQPDPTLTFAAVGLVAGDTLSGALARVPGETVPGSPYAITQGSLTDANNPNYTIAFGNGQLVITPSALAIAADDKTKITGQPNPPFTATFTGFQFGETIADLAGALGFSTPATAGSPSGVYPITPGGVSSTNYAITFIDGQLIVIPVPPAGAGRAPVDNALVSAVERSERDPTEGTERASSPAADCLVLDAAGRRQGLDRCL